jgi:hypothetical protein
MSINFERENPFLGAKSNLDNILSKALNHTNTNKAKTNESNNLKPNNQLTSDSFKLNSNNNINLDSIKGFGIQNGFKPSNN